MAKARKKARKAAKRPAKKRKLAKARRTSKAKARRKARKPISLVEAVAGTPGEARALRSRLVGHNTFED